MGVQEIRRHYESAAMDTTIAIDVRGLTKSYGDVQAVAGIDLRIQRGEIYALVGPNGAGKTTTVEILEGYRPRDAGTVTVLGYDPGQHRRQLKSKIGIVLQSTGIDQFLTVTETIAMYAGYYPNPRPAAEVIELVGLESKRNIRVVKLSGGQQRRLDVAIALAGNPELLFLDEPTTGFDPSARREAWEVVKNLAALGKTVLLTTHYMDEAQYLADRVAVISAGRIVAEGPPGTLGGRELATTVVRFRLPAGQSLPPDLAASREPDGYVSFAPENLTAALHRLTGWATERRIELDSLEIVRASLEDVYLALTSGQPEPAGMTGQSRAAAGQPAARTAAR